MKGQAMLMRMLVVVSCIYILCTAHIHILALARFTVPEFRAGGRYSNLFLATHFVSNIPVMVNSTVGFFVYVKMSSRFRQELKSLCSKMSVTSKPISVSTISHKYTYQEKVEWPYSRSRQAQNRLLKPNVKELFLFWCIPQKIYVFNQREPVTNNWWRLV